MKVPKILAKSSEIWRNLGDSAIEKPDQLTADLDDDKARRDQQFVFVVSNATTIVDLGSQKVQHFIWYILACKARSSLQKIFSWIFWTQLLYSVLFCLPNALRSLPVSSRIGSLLVFVDEKHELLPANCQVLSWALRYAEHTLVVKASPIAKTKKYTLYNTTI